MISIVDENVLIVANDLTRRSLGLPAQCPEAGDECGLACAEALAQLIESGGVGLDEGTEVFDKYRAHCNFDGTPGIGDSFLRAVYERGYVNDWATRVPVREDGEYKIPVEFKNCGFDNDDHVWIALSLNCECDSEILNAVDSDYSEFSDQISSLGVRINELCL